MQWVSIGTEDRFQGDGPFHVFAGGVDLVLVRRAQGLAAFEGLCPHQGALLGEGTLEGGQLVCANHRWTFSCDDGKRVGGPHCLVRAPLRLRDGEIEVDVTELLPRGGKPPTRKAADLPGPKGFPIIGSLFDVKLDRLHHFFEQSAREYGPLSQFRVGPVRYVNCADPALVADALRRRPHTFRRIHRVEEITETLKIAGVFAAEGEAWNPQRRAVASALSARNVRACFPTIRENASGLVDRMAEHARTGASIQIGDELEYFGTGLILQMAFGASPENQDEIRQLTDPLVWMVARRVNSALAYWQWFTPLSERRGVEAAHRLTSWLRGVVKTLRAEIAEQGRASGSLLGPLIRHSDAEGDVFSDDLIVANAITLLVAGSDTTAHSTAWAFHLLLDHPDVLRKVREEVEAVLGGDLLPTSVDQLDAMPYTDRVIHETLRLKNVGPINPVEAIRPTALGDLHLEAGDIVNLLTRPAFTMPDHLEDAQVFRPDRWTEEASLRVLRAPGVFVPFGGGPRLCPGRQLAFYQMRMALAAVVRNFDLVRVGRTEDVTEVFAIPMKAGNFRIRAMERRPRIVAPPRASGAVAEHL